MREREPAPIRSLDRVLRADAHAVILKAMAKDRERRYPSMAELAADVRRILSGEAVAAKGHSRWYVIAKTVRRHRVPLGVAAAFVLVLGLSSVMGWMLYRSAERARSHSAVLLRESYLNEARATRAGNGVGRRFGAAESLKKAAALRMGADLRSEAIAALCISDFQTRWEFPAPPGAAGVGGTPGSARGLARIDRLALVAEDRSIRVVSLETGQDIRRLPARETPPLRLRFNESASSSAPSTPKEAGRSSPSGHSMPRSPCSCEASRAPLRIAPSARPKASLGSRSPSPTPAARGQWGGRRK